MSNILEFVLALTAVLVLVILVKYLPGGCTGDCEQGRNPCDCDNGKWEK